MSVTISDPRTIARLRGVVVGDLADLGAALALECEEGDIDTTQLGAMADRIAGCVDILEQIADGEGESGRRDIHADIHAAAPCGDTANNISADDTTSVEAAEPIPTEPADPLEPATSDEVAKPATAQVSDTKTCKRCRQDKPLSDYHGNVLAADGLNGACRDCRAEQGREAAARQWASDLPMAPLVAAVDAHELPAKKLLGGGSLSTTYYRYKRRGHAPASHVERVCELLGTTVAALYDEDDPPARARPITQPTGQPVTPGRGWADGSNGRAAPTPRGEPTP